MGRSLMPKMRTFVPVIVRGEEAEGVKFWGFGKEVYQELLGVIADPDYGDITDPENPKYDSGAITEMNDYTSDTAGTSAGEPEGLAYKNGYVLVSNTEDPSVALLKSSWAK
ncbi:MAG: hypothetical protein CMF85_05080 [Candidatus Marinimicrobia bacterium]|nr:hypothetical protein [Candidatus Neomarinimicrobiota bacterium]